MLPYGSIPQIFESFWGLHMIKPDFTSTTKSSRQCIMHDSMVRSNQVMANALRVDEASGLSRLSREGCEAKC